LNRYVALAAAVSVIGASAARPAESGSATGNGEEGRPAATAPPIQIRVVEADGFHWDDAAVGSLAAIGLTFVLVGAGFVRRRQ